jgi:hypothetical protein
MTCDRAGMRAPDPALAASSPCRPFHERPLYLTLAAEDTARIAETMAEDSHHEGDHRIAAQRAAAAEILKFVASITAPLYWVCKDENGALTTRNGSAFFLRTPEALFGVTAAHVLEGAGGWRAHCEQHGTTPLRLGGRFESSVILEWDARAVDIDLDIDVATFTVSHLEVEQLGRSIYSGMPTSWPPDAPALGQSIAYAGFPAAGTRQPSTGEVVFGAPVGTGIVHSVTERTISTQLERDFLTPALGEGLPPENFNFGGISGGPLRQRTLSRGGIEGTTLAGVIIQGPNTSAEPRQSISGFELIRSRSIQFIRAEGFLDTDQWLRSYF